MIDPPPRSFIAGAAYLIARNGPIRLTRKDFGPVVGILLEDAGEAAGNAGIGEEDVEPAMVAHRMGDQRLDLLLVARVAFEVGAVEVGADHRRALAGGTARPSPCRCPSRRR